ncbi:MAG: hypothetical protein CMK09_02740 [Ponticaulis sp.]|nr:hypothetical protein [Ponticaulis sp.]|tara:strand:- start:6845 stop:7336 length:492 start_codon:yes stop_codon:yes gene_type:complete
MADAIAPRIWGDFVHTHCAVNCPQLMEVQVKKLILVSVTSGFLCGAASATCTQQDATQMMQKILASSQYSEVVAQAGQVDGPSAERTAAKSGLRRFGGALGGIGADVMQNKDNNDMRNQAQDSATDVKRVTTRMNDAGTALGRSDYETACLLYKKIMTDLKIN